MPDYHVRTLVRDVLLLLCLPALALAGLLAWWQPWEPYPGASAYRARMRRERAAREAAIRAHDWHGLHIEVPDGYFLTTETPLLEVLETTPQAEGPDRWPSRMAFMELDTASSRRFHEAAENCDLAPGRCWSDTVNSYLMVCQQSAGVPDPYLEWTPHLECQVPALSVRMATNAPPGKALELQALFRSAVGTVPRGLPASFGR